MFSITVEQSVLFKALEFLEPTVGKNTNALGDNCISMTIRGQGGVVEMYTTNTVEFTKLDMIAVTATLQGQPYVTAPYVDFKRFKGIISSIPSSEMITIVDNQNDLLINYALKKTPIKLNGCNNGMLPLPTNKFPSNTMISIPRVHMVDTINQVSSIIVDNDAAPIYNCVRLSTNGLNVEFTAIDLANKRAFVKLLTNTQNNPATDVLLEVSKLKKSLKIFEDYLDLDIYSDQTAIRIDGVSLNPNTTGASGMITCISYFMRRLTGVFPPNIRQSFYPFPTDFCEINKFEIFNSVKRIKALEDKTSGGQIDLEVNGSTCTLSMLSSYGQIQDDITMENTATIPFKTVIKHQSLTDILKVIDTDTFEIGILPNHPSNYVVKSKGKNDIMFTIPSMVVKKQQQTPVSES